MGLMQTIQEWVAEYVETRLRRAGIGDSSVRGGAITGPIPDTSLPSHDHTGASGQGGKLTGAVVDTYAEFEEQGSPPSTPASNRGRLYGKDDGGQTMPYWISQSGTETPLAGGGGGGGDLINASTYGVVGDGSTDDSAALQDWLDAVQADGGVGILPAAIYRVATGLTWTALKKAKLLCYGATLLPDNGVIALLIDQDDSGGTVFPVEVAGLMVDGGAKADGCIGIEIADSDYITLRDVRVVNCGTGIRLTVDDTWVEGCLFENVYVKFCTTGIHFRTLTGSAFSSFGETVFQNVGVATCDTGVRVDQNCYLYRSQWNLILWADGNSQKCLSIAGDVYGSHWYVGLERLSGSSTVGIEVTSTALNTDLFTLIVTWNGAFGTRLSIHSSKTLRYREGNVWRVAGTASGVVQQWMTDSDTQPRVQLGTTFPGGGGLEFGPGGSTAMDINLYRNAANSLVTDDAFGIGQFSTAGRPAATAVRAGSLIWNTSTLTVQRSDGTTWTDVGTGTGIASAPFAGALVTKSGAQSLATATVASLTFDQEAIDSDGFHDNVTNNSRLTIPTGKGGTYLIGGIVAIDGDTSAQMTVTIRKNGSTVLATVRTPFVADMSIPAVSISIVAELAATDYVELRAEHDTGSSENITTDSQFWLTALAFNAPVYVGAHVYRTTNQSITTGTLTAIGMDAERNDPLAFHDTSTDNSRLTVPSGYDGYYMATATVRWAAVGTAGTDMIIRIRKNGSTVVASFSYAKAATNTNLEISCTTPGPIALTAGDYLECMVFQNASATLNVEAQGDYSPSFGMWRVGV